MDHARPCDHYNAVVIVSDCARAIITITYVISDHAHQWRDAVEEAFSASDPLTDC